MSNNKQTAVEWIMEQVEQQGITHYFSITEILEQAKEKEEAQIINAFNIGFKDSGLSYLIGEIYYKQTYGGNK